MAMILGRLYPFARIAPLLCHPSVYRNKVLMRMKYRTISGIIVMPWWLKQFSTGHMNKPEIEGGEMTPGISPAESAEIVSILSAGTFFGALFAAPLADKLGRRKALMAAIVIFTVGVVLQTASMRIPLFVAGRYVFTLSLS